jgi:GNAT superfamily N-acetyltransferase
MCTGGVRLPGVDILPVCEQRTLRQFINFPYHLYKDDPYWVPPLRIAQRQLLDKRKHPFYAHAEVQRFLALQNQRPVGRIAAILDRNFNEFHNEQAGFFGFFETINSQEVATALLHAARQWLLERGARVIRGPMNPSTNYECGLLVDGFNSSPRIMMTYNFPFYGQLIKNTGLWKAKDLYAYHGLPTQMSAERAERAARRILKSNSIRIRPIRLEAFEREVELLWSVYNSSWSHNWGFVPMTKKEFFFSAHEMRPIVIPQFVLIGETDNRVIGFALALPDINQALKYTTGRLFPFGLLKILYYRRSIRNLRLMAVGITEEFRAAGVGAAFYAELIRQTRLLNYDDCEYSWVLEDNTLMLRSMEALGAIRYKTYRIYEWH